MINETCFIFLLQLFYILCQQAIVEEKSKLDAADLANLKSDTTSLQKAHSSLKRIVESFPSSLEMMVHETNVKV